MRRDLALESAPWSPLADLDDEDDLASPSVRQDARYQTGWRRYLPKAARGRSGWWWAGRITAAIPRAVHSAGRLSRFHRPLSKSLRPIAPPQITLLAADGTPIARNGAVVDEPVQIAELPDHVTQPFLAIEDRRFLFALGH